MTEACFPIFPTPRPSFPSRFLIGRPRGEAGAERRREELNGYIWHLIHATPEVAEVGVLVSLWSWLLGCSSGVWGRCGAQRQSGGHGSSGLPGSAEEEGRGGRPSAVSGTVTSDRMQPRIQSDARPRKERVPEEKKLVSRRSV